MVFSEALFLFLFLPLTLAAYFAVPRRYRDAVLLTASLAFYATTEGKYLVVMLAYIAVNYCAALWIERGTFAPRRTLITAIVLDLGGLIVFKYANFLVDAFNPLLALVGVSPLSLPPIHLPIGISFFTFQAMSYVIDVYRREVAAERSLFTLALFKALFPQLIAGPIVRYIDVAKQLHQRSVDSELFARGAERFCVGLGKKVLIANPAGQQADHIFGLTAGELSSPTAWLGLLCYALQIYFDFSGYSDMAIGLGRLFGFEFCENFAYPYAAQSITEFWRRWHISLSTWFRDYLYIPLGGNRLGPVRTYVNLLVVFLLCGLWHGASFNFLIWGLLHGAFLVAERAGLSAVLQRLPRPVRHAYTLGAVGLGWVFFRVETLAGAGGYLGALLGLGNMGAAALPLGYFLTPELLLVLAAGIVGATSLPARAWQRSQAALNRNVGFSLYAFGLSALLLACGSKVAAGAYSPFIYFRF